MSMKYVLLPWGEYHNLNALAKASIFDSKDEAESASEHHADHIIEVEGQSKAEDLKRAFETLCYCDWTPNQDNDFKDSTQQDREWAAGVIDGLTERVGAEHMESSI